MISRLLGVAAIFLFDSVAEAQNPECILAVSGKDINAIFHPYARYEWRKLGTDGNFAWPSFKEGSRRGYGYAFGNDLRTFRRSDYDRQAECFPTDNTLWHNYRRPVKDKPYTYLTKIPKVMAAPFIGTLSGNLPSKFLGGSWRDRFEHCFNRAFGAKDDNNNSAVGLEWDYSSGNCTAIFGCELKYTDEGVATNSNHKRSMIFRSTPAPGWARDRQSLANGMRDIYECEKYARYHKNATYASFSNGKCHYSTSKNAPHKATRGSVDYPLYFEIDRYPNCPDEKLKIIDKNETPTATPTPTTATTATTADNSCSTDAAQSCQPCSTKGCVWCEVAVQFERKAVGAAVADGKRVGQCVEKVTTSPFDHCAHLKMNPTKDLGPYYTQSISPTTDCNGPLAFIQTESCGS